MCVRLLDLLAEWRFGKFTNLLVDLLINDWSFDSLIDWLISMIKMMTDCVDSIFDINIFRSSLLSERFKSDQVTIQSSLSNSVFNFDLKIMKMSQKICDS